MFRRLVTVVPRSGVLSPRSVTPAVSGIQQAVRSTVVAPQQQQRRGYHEKDMSTLSPFFTSKKILTIPALLDHYSNPSR